MSSAPTDTHKTFLADLARLYGIAELLPDDGDCAPLK